MKGQHVTQNALWSPIELKSKNAMLKRWSCMLLLEFLHDSSLIKSEDLLTYRKMSRRSDWKAVAAARQKAPKWPGSEWDGEKAAASQTTFSFLGPLFGCSSKEDGKEPALRDPGWFCTIDHILSNLVDNVQAESTICILRSSQEGAHHGCTLSLCHWHSYHQLP